MILKQLALKNFKGIKELTIDFALVTNIFGANETGKTTIYDSFMWVMFGKNSEEKKDFSVKPKLVNGEDTHNLETYVEAVFDLHGKNLKLKRLLEEKWVKKRGSQEAVFEGNATSYWKNDLPVKAKEFEALIEGIVGQEQFKLLTNPLFFNTKMKWEDRRNLLFAINSGENSDTEIIKLNPQLAELTEYLEDYSIEELKKVVRDKKRMLNKEIEKIPTRIDQSNDLLPDISKINQAKSELEEIEKNLASTQDVIGKEEAKRDDVNNKMTEYNKISTEMGLLKNDLQQLNQRQISDKESELFSIESSLRSMKEKVRNLENDLIMYEAKIKDKEEVIALIENELPQMRKDAIQIANSVFVVPDTENMICPTCKQGLPAGDIEKKIEEMQFNFNTTKKNNMQEITTKGKSKKYEIEQISNYLVELKNNFIQTKEEIEEINQSITPQEENWKKLKEEIKELKEQEIDVTTNPEWIKLKEQLDKLEKAEFDSIILDNAKQRLTHYQDKITELKIEISKEDQIKTIKDNIAVLEREAKEKAAEVVKFEKQEFLIEEFIKVKCGVLTEKINDMFKIAKFKLFETQINGGIKDTCICIVDGVPFDDLNNAKKTQVGLDIINTLSNHYDFKAPIFIDNREGVTDIPEVASQIVNLIVSPEDKELRIQC